MSIKLETAGDNFQRLPKFKYNMKPEQRCTIWKRKKNKHYIALIILDPKSRVLFDLTYPPNAFELDVCAVLCHLAIAQ